MKIDERKINKKYLMIGGYVSLICLAVTAAVIVANLLISAVPGRFAKADTSRSEFFTFTEATEKMISAIDEKVDIYLITAYGNENPYIRSAVDAVCDINSDIKRHNADPAGDAALISAYGASSATENSLIIVSGDKYKVVDYLDIFKFGVDYEKLEYTQSFDFEAQIYAALEYVVSDELPKVYYTASNGEAVFEQTVLDNLSKGNIKYESLALEGTVPEDADCIILSNPSKDLTTAQLNALNKYLDKGGRVFVIYNNNPSLDMPNLKTLLKSFGLKNNEGVVLEGDTSLMFKYNGSAVPYVIYSETEKDSLGAELEQMELKPIFQLSTGIGYEDGLDGSIDFTEICMSSDTSFIRPYSSSADSYSKAEGDIGGPICLAVMAEKKTESGTSKLVWLASDDFADASMDDFANGGNSGLISAVTAHLTEKTVNTARAKTIGYDAMEINNVQRTSIAILLIAVVPALFVFYGIYVSKKRKMR